MTLYPGSNTFPSVATFTGIVDAANGGSIITSFPASWRTRVRISRDMGRDEDGNPQAPISHYVNDCLISQGATQDLVDRTDQPMSTHTLFGPLEMNIKDTDRVIVPQTHPMRGVYKVSGRPGFFPLGTVVAMDFVRELTKAEADATSF